MPNNAYERGRKRENRLVRQGRECGCVAFRSAGSHSEIDVCIINPDNHKIAFIQCKPDSMSDKEKQKVLDNMKVRPGMYEVCVSVE